MKVSAQTKFDIGDIAMFNISSDKYSYNCNTNSYTPKLVPVVITGIMISCDIHENIKIYYNCKELNPRESNNRNYIESWTFNGSNKKDTSEDNFLVHPEHTPHPLNISYNLKYHYNDICYLCSAKYWDKDLNDPSNYLYTNRTPKPIKIVGWTYTKLTEGYNKENKKINLAITEYYSYITYEIDWYNSCNNRISKTAEKNNYSYTWETNRENYVVVDVIKNETNYIPPKMIIIDKIPDDFFKKTIKYHYKSYEDSFGGYSKYLDNYTQLAIFLGVYGEVEKLYDEYKKRREEINDKIRKTMRDKKVTDIIQKLTNTGIKISSKGIETALFYDMLSEADKEFIDNEIHDLLYGKIYEIYR